MSDRLQQLRRQRALVAEHLAWLDREIDQALGSPTPQPPPPADDVTTVPFSMRAPVAPPAPVPAASAALPLKSSPVADPTGTAAADAILREYQVEEKSVKSDVRKGCLLYFFGALALVILAVVALYFFFQSTK